MNVFFAAKKLIQEGKVREDGSNEHCYFFAVNKEKVAIAKEISSLVFVFCSCRKKWFCEHRLAALAFKVTEGLI